MVSQRNETKGQEGRGRKEGRKGWARVETTSGIRWISVNRQMELKVAEAC